MDIPPILDIIEHFKDEKSCISWLVDNGIVEIPKCCGKNMKQGVKKTSLTYFNVIVVAYAWLVDLCSKIHFLEVLSYPAIKLCFFATSG